MSWLSRISFDQEQIQDLGLIDSYRWHQRSWAFFPNQPTGSRPFLTRIDELENRSVLWILSAVQPVRPNWCGAEQYEVREIASSFLSHRYYAFSLKANPVRCLVQRDEAGNRKKHGRRIAITDPQQLRAWLSRKATDGGFCLMEDRTLDIGAVSRAHFRNSKHSAYHGGVEFKGFLKVVEHSIFSQTYFSGIGSAKGFGFGLLLLMPVDL